MLWWNPSRQPRDWQLRGVRTLIEKVQEGTATPSPAPPRKTQMVCEVCTGAGKTLFGEMIINEFVNNRRLFTGVCILVPKNVSIKEQWNLAVQPFKNHGIDAKVAYYDDLKLLKSLPSSHLIIADEFHHAIKDKMWGTVASENKENWSVLLSATPQNNNRISAFTRMEVVFSYTYAEALRDGLVRRLHNHPLNGVVDFAYMGTRHREPFLHLDTEQPNTLALPLDSRRYSAASQLTSHLQDEQGSFDLLPKLIKSACEKLRHVQQTFPKAQGIIFAHDTQTADEIKQHMENNRIRPIVVHSHVHNSKRLLTDFANNPGCTYPWLIVCNMAAEGTDLPNTCVAVFSHKYRTQLFIIQAIGRILRRSSIDTRDLEDAWVYYPQDPKIDEYVSSLACTPELQQGLTTDDEGEYNDDMGELGTIENGNVDPGTVSSSSDEEFEEEDRMDGPIGSTPIVATTEIENDVAEVMAVLSRHNPHLEQIELERRAREFLNVSPSLSCMDDEHKRKKLLKAITRFVTSYVKKFRRALRLRGDASHLWRRLAVENIKLVKRYKRFNKKRNTHMTDQTIRTTRLAGLSLHDLRLLTENCLPARKCKLRRQDMNEMIA